MMDKQETQEIFINPFYAINISSSLTGEHEPMASKDEWIKVNSKLIDELGKEMWLEMLLEILEKGQLGR
jgi:hypothetical protein